MVKLKNDRFLRALLRQPVDRTPVWVMRQAGRYLPEYRKLKSKFCNFMTLCTTPELACEITMQPLQRFDLDAAIIFSDILTIPDAMGFGLHFIPNKGPKFNKCINSASDIKSLYLPDIENSLSYVMDAVRMAREEIDGKVPLIGFSGSPWTLACYMVEGGSSKYFSKVKGMMFESPRQMHILLNILTKLVIVYLNAQIAAGAQAIMLFDTWGGILSSDKYKKFSLHYMHQIVQNLSRKFKGDIVPTILFTKGGGQWLNVIAKTGVDAIGLDWTTDLALARQLVGDKVALQGNMDPCVLYASSKFISQEVASILASFGKARTGHIFNLGHGIQPTIDPKKMEVLVNSVHSLSKPFYQ